ncbi:MAG: NAD(P)-dependent glycerol-3-phosphate dehydrogenase [Gallionella sp.]|nr:NAD(P)-dependent glycerol-3-phosphate dehydrogenase [Gallionella sp.]
MRIAVMGAGAWGTALAISFAARHQVTLWARDEQQIAVMRSTCRNHRYLPDITLPAHLALTANLTVALNEVELIVLAVPVSGLRPALQQLLQVTSGLENASFGVVWLCKGFEAESALLPHQIIAEILPTTIPCGVLSGPSFAQEVARGLPTAVTLASTDQDFAQRTAHELHFSRLRVYASQDVIGVEVGGAVKNVMAIAAGICDGMGLGYNARAALIARGLSEINRLGMRLGGQPETLSGLSGAGDLILTCTGDLSRNRQVGLLLAQQHGLADILDKLGHVAEGVYTVRAVHHLAQKLNVSMPICAAVYRILYENIPTSDVVDELLNRSPNWEFTDG